MKRLLLALLVACGAPATRLGSPSPAPPTPPTPTETQRAVVADGEPQIADLGDFALASGETIHDCKIGYRTFGKLDAKRSNVVLFPTWFTGTTKSLLDSVPSKLVDGARTYLILVDALADGVSSGPSSSAKQPRTKFPKVTIRDMVESQKKLLDQLGVRRLHAVMGISMGGMQAVEWAVAHPEMVERAIPIVGTPRLTSQDLLLWNAEMHALVNDVAYKNGDYEGRPKIAAVQDIHWLMLATPGYRATETSREAFPAWLAEKENDTTFDWNDWRWQLDAMLVHDVAHGGDLDAVARGIRAGAGKPKILAVVAEHDHMVNPLPMKRFAELAGAKIVVLDGPCGHLAPGCEAAKLAAATRDFLAQ